MKLSVLLVTKEDRGSEGFADVIVAYEAKPGETVDDFAARLFGQNSVFKGEETNYLAKIEIRQVKE
jgi:hypothetical protein